MLKLIKLEFKKIGLGRLLKSDLIAALVSLGVFMFICFVTRSEGEFPFKNFNDIVMGTDSMVRPIYMIFAAVLINRLIIEEYKNKTISVMFMYPISRKKIFISKLIIIFLFTFFSVIIVDILITSVFYLVNSLTVFVPVSLQADNIVKGTVQILVNAITCAGLSLIPMYFGMRKKSLTSTIVSSIIMVSIVGSNIDGTFTLYSIIAIPVTLAVIGITIAYLAIRNIEHVDIA